MSKKVWSFKMGRYFESDLYRQLTYLYVYRVLFLWVTSIGSATKEGGHVFQEIIYDGSLIKYMMFEKPNLKFGKTGKRFTSLRL